MFNYRLKEVRKSLNMDAEEFASEFGIAKSSVYAYERGTNKPSYELLELLMQRLKISPNWLFTGQGEMFQKSDNTLSIKYEPLKIDKYEFGKRVNKIRITADLVSLQMAEMLDMKEKELAALISGEGKITIELLQKLCENFDITADWLLFGKE